jgi:peptidoglycan/LPS O-acetylase OafA/YrhL
MPALDGLRGIAILMVIPHNTNMYPTEHHWAWPFALQAHTGWIGVQLFFALSGFLITDRLLAGRGAPGYYAHFFARRMLRIFPLYFMTLAFFLVLLPHLTSLRPDILASYRHQIWLWTFLSNWTVPSGKSVYWFTHFWSLAVEEQFYLVWPFVIAWVAGTRRVAWLCAGIATAALVIRCIMVARGAVPDMVYMYTVSRMDALACGALVACALRAGGAEAFLRAYSARIATAALFMLVGDALITHFYDQPNRVLMTIGYTILAVAMALLVAVAAQQPAPGKAPALNRWLSMPALRSVGKYSYAMYVFHLPFSLLLQDRMLEPLKPVGPLYPLLYSVLIALISYAAAVLSYHALEKHFLGLKRHFPAIQAAA